MSERARILYVQRPTGGGSAVALRQLVRGLDRERYEAVVFFYEPNPWCERLREEGARVLVLPEAWTGSRRAAARTRQADERAGERVAGDGAPDERTPRTRGSTGCGAGRGGRTRRRVRTRRRDPAGDRPRRQISRLIRRELPLARRMARLIRDERVDLVHHNNNPRANRASIIAARLAGARQLCHARMLTRYFRPLDGFLARWIGRYVYVSRAVRSQCREQIGSGAERGAVLHDPVDLDALARGRHGAARVRAELDLRPGERVVANVGRLVGWKGQLDFIDAVARVARREPDVRALIVGSPPRSRSGRRYAERLRRRVAEHGIGDRVVFTGHRDDVPAVMAAADVVVHSSCIAEPFGLVVAEAMAAGRPVVATAAGGPTETVDHGRTGLLVPPARPAAMADAITRVLADPALAARMAHAAEREAQWRFAPSRHRDAMARLYERMVGWND